MQHVFQSQSQLTSVTSEGTDYSYCRAIQLFRGGGIAAVWSFQSKLPQHMQLQLCALMKLGFSENQTSWKLNELLRQGSINTT